MYLDNDFKTEFHSLFSLYRILLVSPMGSVILLHSILIIKAEEIFLFSESTLYNYRNNAM